MYISLCKELDCYVCCCCGGVEVYNDGMCVYGERLVVVGECLLAHVLTHQPLAQRHRSARQSRLQMFAVEKLLAATRDSAWPAHQVQFEKHGINGRCSAFHGARSGLWVSAGLDIGLWCILAPWL